MADYDEIFSSTPPIPKRKGVPPPEPAAQKRKYTRKGAEQKQEQIEVTSVVGDDIEQIAEQLFEDAQMCNYYMVKSFFELCAMVDPKDYKKMAQILEGLIAK